MFVSCCWIFGFFLLVLCRVVFSFLRSVFLLLVLLLIWFEFGRLLLFNRLLILLFELEVCMFKVLLFVCFDFLWGLFIFLGFDFELVGLDFWCGCFLCGFGGCWFSMLLFLLRCLYIFFIMFVMWFIFWFRFVIVFLRVGLGFGGLVVVFGG